MLWFPVLIIGKLIVIDWTSIILWLFWTFKVSIRTSCPNEFNPTKTNINVRRFVILNAAEHPLNKAGSLTPNLAESTQGSLPAQAMAESCEGRLIYISVPFWLLLAIARIFLRISPPPSICRSPHTGCLYLQIPAPSFPLGEQTGRILQKLLLPGWYLIGTQFILLGQFLKVCCSLKPQQLISLWTLPKMIFSFA